MAVRDVNTGSLDRLGPARSTHPFKARQGLKSPSTSHLFSRVSVYYEDTREPFYIFVFSKYNSFFFKNSKYNTEDFIHRLLKVKTQLHPNAD